MSGWNQAPGWATTTQCEAIDAAGIRCALAAGHAGNHETPAALNARSKSQTATRIGIAIAVLVGIWLLINVLRTGMPLPV